MGFFDFFGNSVKREFDNFISNDENLKALKSYVRNVYEITPDMSNSDKVLFKDCMNAVSEDFLPQIIGTSSMTEWPKEVKKYVVQNEPYILRVYRVRLKYSTLQRRAAYLYSRYAHDGIFAHVFGEKYDRKYNWNDATDEECQYILDRTELLVDKAKSLQEAKNKRKAELRLRLKPQADARKIRSLVAIQKKSKSLIYNSSERSELYPVILDKVKNCYDMPRKWPGLKWFMNELNWAKVGRLSELTEGQLIYLLSYETDINKQIEARNKIFSLKEKYKEDDVFNRVVASVLGQEERVGHMSYEQISQILDNQDEFERESQALKNIRTQVGDLSFAKQFLESQDLNFDHDGILSLTDNDSWEEYIKENYSEIIFKGWIEKQNRCVDFEKNFYLTDMTDFVCKKLRMIVHKVSEETGDDYKNYLVFNHFIRYDFSDNLFPFVSSTSIELTDLIDSNQLLTDIKSGKTKINVTIIDSIVVFLKHLNYHYSSNLTVLLVTQEEPELSKSILHRLIMILKRKRIDYIGYDSLDEHCVRDHIVAVELISRVHGFHDVCRDLTRRYPDHTLCYISVFNELTKNNLSVS